MESFASFTSKKASGPGQGEEFNPGTILVIGPSMVDKDESPRTGSLR